MTYLLGKTLITVQYFSLPNLIADDELLPEFPLVRRKSRHVERLQAHLDEWLTHPHELAKCQRRMSQLAEDIVEVGGVQRVAQVLLERLSAGETLMQSRTRNAA